MDQLINSLVYKMSDDCEKMAIKISQNCRWRLQIAFVVQMTVKPKYFSIYNDENPHILEAETISLTVLLDKLQNYLIFNIVDN